MTNQQKPPKPATPPQKIHLSCFALLSTMRIVSPLTPSVFATLYSFFCVPLSISFCAPRSPRTARPRSRYSSSCAFVCDMNDCSCKAAASRVESDGEVPKESCPAMFRYVDGGPEKRGELEGMGGGDEYGFSGVDDEWWGRRGRVEAWAKVVCEA